MGFLKAIVKAVRPLVPDSVRDWGAREYFNRHYSSFGRMTTLHIDSAKRKATMQLDLKGEIQPLHLVVDEYVVSSENGKTFIEIKQLTTSRDWLNIAAKELLKDKKFEVPEILKSIL